MASEKRDYSDLIAAKAGDELEGAIRKLMEGLHKSMLKQLSRGEHEPAIEQRMGADVFRAETTPPVSQTPTVTGKEPPAPLMNVPTETSPLAPSLALPPSPPPSPSPSPSLSPPRFRSLPPSYSPSLSPSGAQSVSAAMDAEPVRAEPTRLEAEGEAQPVSRLSRVFGERAVSEKPLDEVVLDYLIESARKRKRSIK